MTRQKNGVWKISDREMNLLSILAFEASEHYTLKGCAILSEEASEISSEIFNILENAGYYNDRK